MLMSANIPWAAIAGEACDVELLDHPNGTLSERAIGAEVVRAVLSEPLRWIATNAGHDGEAVVERVRTLSPG